MASTPTVTQAPSLASLQTDPLRVFKFHVRINSPLLASDYPQLGFMTVSGLSVVTDVIAYRQGGDNVSTRKLPGQTDYSPITLARGLIPGGANYQSATGNHIMDWMQQLFIVQQGSGSSDTATDFRCNVDIMLIDHPVTTKTAAVKACWRVYNAWPTAVTFSDLDAGLNNIAVSQVTLAHEGWDFRMAQTSGPGSTASF